ncbi:MAG: hypothetical protein IKM19_09810 [Firmicutes bacterium]|nr:hypothetical protein [Bacillota bacterium]
MAGETEIGKIYYRPQEIIFGPDPQVHLIKFFMGQRVAFKDIRALI